MTLETDGGQALGKLTAPERNAYFYGKLLDDAHLRMEQRYFNRKRWLLNRLAVGTGVLCGLTVREKQGLLCIAPGVALDAFGREIVVPEEVLVDPWIAFDAAGARRDLAKTSAHATWLCLAYDECETELVPVLVADCDSQGGARASTIVEGFTLTVRTDAVPALPARPREALCTALHAGPTQADRVRALTAATIDDSCATTGGPCVPLARVALTADGKIGTIDPCADRPVAYGNAELFEMILCLAARIEECCGETPPTTTPVPVFSLAYVAGDNQSATKGTVVGAPLVVEVRRDGVARAGETVTFTVMSGGGTVSATSAGAAGSSATVVSDASGRASLPVWKLGAAAGPNSVRASIAAGTPREFLFRASATEPVTPHVEVVTLAMISGDNQSGPVSQAVPAPLVVEVRADGVPAAGRSVTFTVSAGGGVVATTAAGALGTAGTVTTDATGRASLPVWKLGSSAGPANRVTASIPNGSPGQVTFTATGVAPRVLALTMVSGDGQTAAPATKVSQPLVVEVRDNGAPVAGEPVTFVVKLGGGKVAATATGALANQVTLTTDAAGRASLPAWQLGAAFGGNMVAAQIATGNPSDVVFKATARATDEPTLRVTAVAFLNSKRKVVGALGGPPLDAELKASLKAVFIRFTFNRAPDPATLVPFDGTTSPSHGPTVLVAAQGRPPAFLRGKIIVDAAHPTVAVWSPLDGKTPFAPGAYLGALVSTSGKPSVTGIDGRLLDGEPVQLPSGDGSTGGNFEFQFTVA